MVLNKTIMEMILVHHASRTRRIQAGMLCWQLRHLVSRLIEEANNMEPFVLLIQKTNLYSRRIHQRKFQPFKIMGNRLIWMTTCSKLTASLKQSMKFLQTNYNKIPFRRNKNSYKISKIQFLLLIEWNMMKRMRDINWCWWTSDIR